MCFSTMVERDLKRLEREFSAIVDTGAMSAFRQIQATESWMKKSEVKASLGLAREPKVSFVLPLIQIQVEFFQATLHRQL